MTEHDTFMCPRCMIGRCKPGHITYVRMYEGQLLRMPNMPVYTCDVCDYQEFDGEMIARLEALVGEIETPVGDDVQPVTKAPSLDTMDAQDIKTTRRTKP